MITQCPHCKARFKVREEIIGRKAKCAKCGRPFTITSIGVNLSKCSLCGSVLGTSEQTTSNVPKRICRECFERMTEPEEGVSPFSMAENAYACAKRAIFYAVVPWAFAPLVVLASVLRFELIAMSLGAAIVLSLFILYLYAFILVTRAVIMASISRTWMRIRGDYDGIRYVKRVRIVSFCFLALVFAGPILNVAFGPDRSSSTSPLDGIWLAVAFVNFWIYIGMAVWIGKDSSALIRKLTPTEIESVGGFIARSPAGWVFASTSLGAIGWILYSRQKERYIECLWARLRSHSAKGEEG